MENSELLNVVDVRQGMAQALQVAGLPLEGRHHRGEDDAWNIAALTLHLVSLDPRHADRLTAAPA
ncbi:hypothetical protein [Nonomuraea recticatena]|uniref:Exonuclease domain-containing protein n=1 Tax=Nonomuraea recticatena TaxID=46178 RepID=A0ABN3R489_9ACTN